MTADESERFDRLPESADDPNLVGDEDGAPRREEDGSRKAQLSRETVVSWWEERFGIPPTTFDEHTFWERGAGKVWAFRGDLPSPVRIQGLGMHVLRTGGDHWKPTTNAVQRFGRHATRNVLVLEDDVAAAFVRGEDRPVAWDGDWGYLVVARSIADQVAPIGVGLYIDGELRSQIPKGRRRDV